MKLSKVILLLVGMLTINALAMVEQSCSANLGLLVNNSASLDAEEQAASDFASNHGFTVTLIDPNSIISDPSILNNVCGFWADNGGVPSGYNQSGVTQPLLNAINSGKGILFQQYGGFIGEYLGLGTATTGYWCPVHADEEYFVEALQSHSIFNGIATWPSPNPPNIPEQLIYRVNTGCKTGAGINLSNAQTYEKIIIVDVGWWCCLSYDPNFCQQYNVECTGSRIVAKGSIAVKQVGQGVAVTLNENGFTLGTFGPAGVTMLVNALNYICGGAPPQTLPAPVLAWPENGEDKCLHIPISFTWGMVPGAASYEIEFSTTENFQAIFHSATVSGNIYKYLLPANMLPEQRCYWRIRGRADGVMGEYSETRYLYARSRNTVYGRLLDARTGNPIELGKVEVEIFNDQDAETPTIGGSARSDVALGGDGGYFGLCFPDLNDVYRRIWIKAEDLKSDDQDGAHYPTRLVDSCVTGLWSKRIDVKLVGYGEIELNPYEEMIGGTTDRKFSIAYSTTGNNACFEPEFKSPVYDGENLLGYIPVYVSEIAKTLNHAATTFSQLGLGNWQSWFGWFSGPYRVYVKDTGVFGGITYAGIETSIRNDFESDLAPTVYSILRFCVSHEMMHWLRGFWACLGGSSEEAVCQWAANAVNHSQYYQKAGPLIGLSGWVWCMNDYGGDGQYVVFNNPHDDFWWPGWSIQERSHGYSRTALLLQYYYQHYGTTFTLYDEWNRPYSVWKTQELLPELEDIVYHNFAMANVAKKGADPNSKYSYKEFADQYDDMTLPYRVQVSPFMIFSTDLGTVQVHGSQYLVLLQPDEGGKKSCDVQINAPAGVNIEWYKFYISWLDFKNDRLVAVRELVPNWLPSPISPDSTILVITRGRSGAYWDTKYIEFPLTVKLLFDKEGSITATCPVGIRLEGPNGLFYCSDNGNIDSAVYVISRDTVGRKIGATIAWRALMPSKWRVKVIPDSTATPDSSFSLYFWTPEDSFYIGQNMRISEIPAEGFVFYPDPYATIDGFVKDQLLHGLLGVTLDIYDEGGNLWKSLVTDDSGYYHIDSIPNGNYSISVVTPLGYQADQETKEFAINHVPVTVNFSLTKLGVTPRQRSCAYWADQLCRALQNKPKEYTRANFSRFAGLIKVHFNQNEVNPVDFYTVPQPANQNDSLIVMKKILTMCNNENEPLLKRLAKAQLMALMLNVVSGKIHQTQEISADNRTVSQAITFCDQLIGGEINCPDNIPGHNNPHCPYILSELILILINVGATVPRNLIPANVIQIAYDIHIPESVPAHFALYQNYPNPFNPTCEIGYALPIDCQVTLSIYNVLGQKAKVLVDEYQTAGNKTVHWDGKDDQGREVTSGIYFYRIKAGDFTETKKMILVK